MTLTEFSVFFRKALPVVVISVLLILIMYFGLQIALRSNPQPPPPENPYNLVFDKISPLKPNEATSSAQFNYTFDTVEGIPVSPAEYAKVFFIPEQNRQIGFSLKTNAMAEKLGFDVASTEGVITFPTITYENTKQKLIVDITRYNYDYQYVLGTDDTFLNNLVTVPEEAEIIRGATTFLTDIGRYPDELAQGQPNIVYLTFDPVERRISITDDPKSANMVEIDFYRADIDGFPSVTASYFNSQNYVLMLYHARGSKVIRAQVNFFETASDQIGVYPLKSGDTAWQEVVEGKGIVAYADPAVKDVVIKQMFLAYYDPSEYQEYLQPVYVFLGGRESNFAVYVPAVDNNQLIESDQPVE